MIKVKKINKTIFGVFLLFLSACSQQPIQTTYPYGASAPMLAVDRAVVLTDNQQAFAQKLRLIQQAKTQIDMAYYIYANDYSSAMLSQALLVAAQRGVKVRLLVDYHTNYKRLDFFLMLQQRSQGNIHVRFYNRPSDNIIKDALFLTSACPDKTSNNQMRCGQQKFAQIAKAFGNQSMIAVNSGYSGQFLSGLYGGNLDLMTHAIMQGQQLDLSAYLEQTGEASSDEDLDKLLDFAKLYLDSRFSEGFKQLKAKFKVDLALLLYSEKLTPIIDTATSVLPLGERPKDKIAWRDWQHITDYLHHKFLLVDQQYLQLGGRNIEDPYHMQLNPLIKHYVFMDTDVSVRLQQADKLLADSFEHLWNFTQMTTDVDQVLQHAPNDFLVADAYAKAQCGEDQTCYDKVFVQQTRQTRQQRAYDELQANIAVYRQNNPQLVKHQPDFTIDAGAELYYVENLPYNQNQAEPRSRLFGATNGKEIASGKAIHALWIDALKNACQQASADNPQTVWLHNAYFFLPSNLLVQFAKMVDGSQDCDHVTINVVTNSLASTDLGIINLTTRYSMKAFADYYQQQNHAKGATFHYYEYQPRYQNHKGQSSNRYSLHSKVAVFGDNIFIGSANSDVRSYMMDSNNGLWIKNAPNFVHAYTAELHQKIADPKQIKKITDDFYVLDLETLLAEDKPRVFGLVAKLFAAEENDATKNNTVLLQRIDKILRTVYQLSFDSLHQENSTDEQAQFNAYFKLL